MNVPKLRFKEFTGEWEKYRLGCFIKEFGEKSTVENQYPMLTSSREGLMLQEDYYSSDNRLVNRSSIGYNVLPFGYVTFRNRSDDGFFYFNINNKIDNGLISYFYPVFCVNGYNTNFIVELLNCTYRKMLNIMSTGTSQKVLSFSQLKELDVLLPGISESEKISSLIDYVVRKIKNQQAIVESLEKQKKALMKKIFSQELRFKDDDGKEFPDWEEKKLGEAGCFTKGGNLSKADLSDEGTECILYGELYTRYSEIAEKIVSKTSVEETVLCLSKVNDVLLPSSGETPEDISTATCILREGVALGGDIIVYRSDLLDGRFNSYLLNYKCKLDIAKIAQGKSVVHINANALKNILVPVPCLEEQNKIVEFLFSMNKKMENTIETLEHWKQIKKGLLQQMFV